MGPPSVDDGNQFEQLADLYDSFDGFNGATVRRRWKQRSLRKILLMLVCFNGATVRRRWKPYSSSDG